MENEIKAGEVQGTVRKAFKLFQEFEHLNKVLSFLAGQEEYEAKLNASIRNKEIEGAELDEIIESKTSVVNALNVKIEAARKDVTEALANQAKTRSTIVESAEKEAQAILEKAHSEVSGMADRVNTLKNQIKTLEASVAAKQGELEDLHRQYRQEKDKIIKALNG